MSLLLRRGYYMHKLRYWWLPIFAREPMSDRMPRQVYRRPEFKQLQELQLKVWDMWRSPNLLYIVWQEFTFQVLLPRRLYWGLYSKVKCASWWQMCWMWLYLLGMRRYALNMHQMWVSHEAWPENFYMWRSLRAWNTSIQHCVIRVRILYWHMYKMCWW